MNDQPNEFADPPSKYLWRWTLWSWVCVGVGVLIVALGLTGGGSVAPWIVAGALVALVGGIAFGFVPRASLGHTPRPMTEKARRRSAGH